MYPKPKSIAFFFMITGIEEDCLHGFLEGCIAHRSKKPFCRPC